MNTQVTTIQTGDGWDDAAAESAERIIRGTLLKFADWRWSRGKEATPVDDGTPLVALGTAAAWVRWEGGKPNEYRVRQAGKRLPDREELPDQNEDDWEAGPDGETKRDPWQSTRFVYLVDPQSAEAFTFSTSSWGGRAAVNDLGDQIQRMRFANPNAVPVVELRAVPMLTRFGRKSKPWFKVVGWRKGAEPANPLPATATPQLAIGHAPAAPDMDDAIPF